MNLFEFLQWVLGDFWRVVGLFVLQIGFAIMIPTIKIGKTVTFESARDHS